MPLNQYFSNLGENFDNTNEQDLISNLMDEAISIMGVRAYYITRTDENLDALFGEDTNPQFNQADEMAMYVENIDSWEGQDEFLTEYGIAFQDQVDFRLARVEYERVFGEGNEPTEGDLVYMPLTKNIFQIVKARKENQFYPTGILPSFLLLCEEYVYSQEDFATTLAEIDDIENNKEIEATTPERVGHNEALQTDADTIISFDEDNPFGSY